MSTEHSESLMVNMCAGETEEGMYRILGLDIMPPEMRGEQRRDRSFS